MRKESCWNCSTRIVDRAAFCATCGQPTPHATDADRLDFDLKQWRAHVEKSVVNGGKARQVQPAAPVRTGVSTALRRETAEAPMPMAAAPAAAPTEPKRRRPTVPKLRLPTIRMPRRPEVERREINLDDDDPFAYRECITCGEVDWLLRGRRNDDGTFNYWCVRCSRAFKTTVRIAHGRKPFLAAGSVVALLITLMYLLR